MNEIDKNASTIMTNVTTKIFMTDGMDAPSYSRDGDAAIDLKASKDITIPARDHKLVPTGFHIAIPENHVGLLFPRSGNALNDGIGLRNSVGVIDSNYRGDVGAILDNATDEEFHVTRNTRIAQLIIIPIPHVTLESCSKKEFDNLNTNRGDKGFGSSGK